MAAWTQRPPGTRSGFNGHLDAMMLSAFPTMAPQWHGAETVLIGLLDRSALYGVLTGMDALCLDLLEARPARAEPRITGTRWRPHDIADHGRGRAAGLRAGSPVLARPRCQRPGILRRTRGAEPLLGHRRRLSLRVPGYPRRRGAVRRAPVHRPQPAARRERYRRGRGGG